MRNIPFLALLLIAPVAFAQHGRGSGFASPARGFAIGAPGVRGRAGAGTFVRPNRFLNRRFGNGFYSPYFPLVADYGYWGDYPYWGYPYSGGYPEGYPSSGNVSFNAPFEMQPPQEPVQTAHAVIHEYNVQNEAGTAGTTANAFSIALKDGSQRSAIATWLQDGKLHYLDADGRQYELSSESIDRATTNRLNQEKHLHLQLPPA